MIAAQIKFLHSMLKNQWKSYHALRKMQNNNLRKLIDHAYVQVPYYRDLFDSCHLKPDDIRQTEDFVEKFRYRQKKIFRKPRWIR